MKHDFETWKPTLSERAVVLLHDISVLRDDFGVWRLWDELKGKYPSFEFQNCNGLGVLAVGESVPSPADRLFCLTPDQVVYVRALYGRLGQSVRDWRSQLSSASKDLNDIKTSRSWMIANSIANFTQILRRKQRHI